MITSNQILQELQLTSNVKYLIPLATAIGGGYLANHAHEFSSLKDFAAQTNDAIANKKPVEEYDPSTIGSALQTGAGALTGLALGSGALGYKLSKEQNKNNLSNILK